MPCVKSVALTEIPLNPFLIPVSTQGTDRHPKFVYDSNIEMNL